MIRRSSALALLGALALGLATAAPATAASPSGASGAAPVGSVRRRPGPQLMPMRNPGAPAPASAPAGAHLTYYGGRVVSNVKVVQVLWGTGTYASEVTSTATPSINSMYAQVSSSAYFDWLTEYNTPAVGGTNQKIGHGTFGGQVTITPSVTTSTITDAQIQAEISAQVRAGHLPAPTADAAGNNNTYYSLFFPFGKTISQGGSLSCHAGGFVAYHGTIANITGFGEVYYGVQPDFEPGSGCDSGAGTGTQFQNEQSAATHELVETVTDPEIGLATLIGPPVAWYDSTNGEIGDICNAQQGSIVGADGQAYTVQKEFSNAMNNCIVTKPTPINDFTLTASTLGLMVSPGSTVKVTIATSLASGVAGTVALSVAGAPVGVAASITPQSVTVGGASTLKLVAGNAAPPGSYPITVTGTEGAVTHTVTVTLSVYGINNGGFEKALAAWTLVGAGSSSATAKTGTKSAQLGSTAPTMGDSSVAQTFTTPPGSTKLTFWYEQTCPDTVTFDWATATIRDNTTATTTTILPKVCLTGTWTKVTTAVVPLHSYTLTLVNHDDNSAGDATFTLFDGVVLTVVNPSIANGGFEAGLTGWTPAGVAVSPVSAGAHSGTGAALLGATTATSGDSSLSQSFIAPVGSSVLSVWYQPHCPDTVTYDWATVTLLDAGTAVTTTVLARACANDGVWHNVTAPVIAGHHYTVTLTSHDDGYVSDPTYTLFDDVALS